MLVLIKFKRWIAALVLIASTGPTFAADIPSDVRIDVPSLVVSKSELICLALNDYFESRGEPMRGRIAVAQVVLNRSMDDRYPINICDVVQQNLSRTQRACQFSWFCDGRSDTPRDGRAWRQSLLLAAAMLSRDSAVADPTGGALWYHATHVRPNWTARLAKVDVIGDHIFYRDPDYRPAAVRVSWGAALRRVFVGGDSSRFAEWRETLASDVQLAQN